jgi:DNA processing protein
MTQILDKSLYPPNLNDWHYKNRELWYVGRLDLLKMPLVSIVGTRKVSVEGEIKTKKLARFLAERGYCIVSGLAEGVDTVAHRAVLEAGGCTIAVLGTAVDQCYPKNNKDLKEQIERRGLVLSQFAPGERTFPSNFPKRNALMAALTSTTVVIQASAQSGTRHQVKAAVRLSRKVGFMETLVDKNIPWVAEAIESGNGAIIETPRDLLRLLASYDGGVNAKNGTTQMRGESRAQTVMPFSPVGLSEPSAPGTDNAKMGLLLVEWVKNGS